MSISLSPAHSAGVSQQTRLLLYAIAFLTVFLPTSCLAALQIECPPEVSQGRAFVIRVIDDASTEVSIQWQEKKLPLLLNRQQGDQWCGELLLGMPMDATGQHTMSISYNGEEHNRTISALSVPWKEQILTVEPKYVEPPKEVQEQIARDTAASRKAIASLRTEQDWSLPFFRPVKGTISSAFGGRRVFNGQPRSPHRGTDLRGPTGTPIHAVAAGIVTLAEPQYFSGNVVYVDHGQGVISMYAHMSAFDVKVGDRVERGQILGKVGATGRVTGPHLHLGLMIQGVAVDAMPFFESSLAITGGPTKEQAVTPAN